MNGSGLLFSVINAVEPAVVDFNFITGEIVVKPYLVSLWWIIAECD